MEIVSVDSRTWNMMLDRFEEVARRMEKIFGEEDNRPMQGWLDGQEVCEILSISKRTLQTMRDKGVIGYTSSSGKCYYKPDEIESYIKKHKRDE